MGYPMICEKINKEEKSGEETNEDLVVSGLVFGSDSFQDGARLVHRS